jgi:hypothetical protein
MSVQCFFQPLRQAQRCAPVVYRPGNLLPQHEVGRIAEAPKRRSAEAPHHIITGAPVNLRNRPDACSHELLFTNAMASIRRMATSLHSPKRLITSSPQAAAARQPAAFVHQFDCHLLLKPRFTGASEGRRQHLARCQRSAHPLGRIATPSRIPLFSSALATNC